MVLLSLIATAVKKINATLLINRNSVFSEQWRKKTNASLKLDLFTSGHRILDSSPITFLYRKKNKQKKQ